MLIVLDTNILVSALMKHGGPPEQLLNLWEDKRFELITSEFQHDELSRVLSYERVRRYVSEEQVARLNQLLADFAVMAEPTPDVSLSDDSDDNIIIGTAIGGFADMLVSGDKKHLLPLGNAHGIPIVPPVEAVQRIMGVGTQ